MATDVLTMLSMGTAAWRAVRRLARGVAVGGLVLVLGACYFPARFGAEIELSRTGYYTLAVDGYFARIKLYEGLHKRTLSTKEEHRQIDQVLEDLRRDGAIKEASYHEKGHFYLLWRRSGNLQEDKHVTFLRRNENLLNLSYSKTRRTVEFKGKYLKKENIDRLVDIGLWSTGDIRLKTDAVVVEHNATTVEKGEGREVTLVWSLTSPYQPPPRALFVLK